MFCHTVSVSTLRRLAQVECKVVAKHSTQYFGVKFLDTLTLRFQPLSRVLPGPPLARS